MGAEFLCPGAIREAIAREVTGSAQRRREKGLAWSASRGIWPQHGLAYRRADATWRVSNRPASNTRTASAPCFRHKRSPDDRRTSRNVKLDHMRVLTDDTGILQHATFNVPRYADGYCLDDNARALLVMALVEDAGTEDPKLVRELTSRYLGFISYAFDQTTGRFRNFMSYGRNWIEDCGSEDSQGRALWALGTLWDDRRTRAPGIWQASCFVRTECDLRIFEPESVGLHAARNRRVPALFHEDEHVESILKSAFGASSESLSAHQPDRISRGSKTGSPIATRGCRTLCSYRERG